MYLLFLFNLTSPTQIYTLSLHDALPISQISALAATSQAGALRCSAWHHLNNQQAVDCSGGARRSSGARRLDRKSTRLNSSHGYISYAVFCLKKKKKKKKKYKPYISNITN